MTGGLFLVGKMERIASFNHNYDLGREPYTYYNSDASIKVFVYQRDGLPHRDIRLSESQIGRNAHILEPDGLHSLHKAYEPILI